MPEYMGQLEAQNRETSATSFDDEVISHLRRNNFEEAIRIVKEYKAHSPIHRNLPFEPDKQIIQKLEWIFYRRPKILTSVSEDELNALRIAAAMMVLWAVNRPSRWLPKDFNVQLFMDRDSAARMPYFYANFRSKLELARFAEIAEVEILTADDEYVCPECSRLNHRKYRIDDVPELPFHKCASGFGCRCVIV